MGRWLQAGSALFALGCAAQPPSPGPASPKKAAPAEAVLFCASTVVERDAPQCRGQLTAEQQRHRPLSARLLMQKGELVRVDLVSGSGMPQQISSVFERRGDRVVGWSLESRNGVNQGHDVVSDDARWVRWLDEQDRPRASAKTTISGVRRVLSARGRVESFTWVNWLGQPATAGAVHENRLRLDANGDVAERRFYGLRGEAVTDSGGAHRVVYVLGERGAERERRYFDGEGRAAAVEGSHLVRTSVDAFGVPLTEAYYDAQGAPVRSTRDGAAARRYERDERGNEVSVTLLDEQNRPILGTSGWSRRQRVVDELDAVVETSFFGVEGQRVREKERGVATVRVLRSERGNVTSELFFDEAGAPLVGVEGYHRVDIEYDARDNPIRYAYSDPSALPLRSRRQFYDGDRLIREEHLDAAGQPLLTAQGYASYEISYEEDGSEGMKRYFDVSGGQQVTCHGTAPQVLQNELAERAGSLRACYERLLRYGATEEGKLMIELSIDARGQVLNVKLAQDEVGDGDLAKCVVETMRVPYLSKAEGDCATVRVPVTFRQKR